MLEQLCYLLMYLAIVTSKKYHLCFAYVNASRSEIYLNVSGNLTNKRYHLHLSHMIEQNQLDCIRLNQENVH